MNMIHDSDELDRLKMMWKFTEIFLNLNPSFIPSKYIEFYSNVKSFQYNLRDTIVDFFCTALSGLTLVCEDYFVPSLTLLSDLLCLRWDTKKISQLWRLTRPECSIVAKDLDFCVWMFWYCLLLYTAMILNNDVIMTDWQTDLVTMACYF